MSTWGKVADKKDVEKSNFLVLQKQKEEKEEKEKWILPREEILSPYFEHQANLVDVVLDLVSSIKPWANELGWTYENGEFKGIRIGTKVVCTKSFIGHVGYVEVLYDSIIRFRIVSLSKSYEGRYQEARDTWGLAVLPDNVDISKQMTASEAYDYIASFNKKLSSEMQVDEPDDEDKKEILPIVEQLDWGVIKVKLKGETMVFKDAKLYPNGATAWDWGKTGTHHNPGMQYEDVREILDAGVETIILTKGQHQKLRVSEELIAQIDADGVTVHAFETRIAVRMYEQLRKAGMRVGIIIHSTC